MDKVNSVNELKGWREAEGEELKVVTGLLLQDAKSEGKVEWVMKVFLAIFSYSSFVGAWNIFQYLVLYFGDDIGDTILLCVILIGLIAIGVGLGWLIVRELLMKPAKSFRDSVKANFIRVNDVEVYRVVYSKLTTDSPTYTYAKVRDCCGTCCDEKGIEYKSTQVAREGIKAILIETSITQKDGTTFARKCVIPCKEYDSKLWKLGLKYYNKFVK